jgi:hypothetical protein
MKEREPPTIYFPYWYPVARRTRRGEQLERLRMVYVRAMLVSIGRHNYERFEANAISAWRVALELEQIGTR